MLRRSWVSASASFAASWNLTAGCVGSGSTSRDISSALESGALRLIGVPSRSLRGGLHVCLGRGEDLGDVDRVDSRRAAGAGAPPMCIRHELSAAAQYSAPVSSTQRILSESMAIEVSAFFTENVPPNPQHSVGMGQLHEVDPAHLAQQPLGASPIREHPLRVAGRVEGDPVREVGADVLDPELVDQERGELVDPRDRAR